MSVMSSYTFARVAPYCDSSSTRGIKLGVSVAGPLIASASAVHPRSET